MNDWPQHEIYNYMNYLFWHQPSDSWIFQHMNNIDDGLNELVLIGQWDGTRPCIRERELHRFTDKVIKDDMYSIVLWRVQYVKDHYEEYSSGGGQVRNLEHESGMSDPYFSLRQYCLQTFPTTDDMEIDSIYFVKVYPDG